MSFVASPMKHSLSNIALSAYNHADELKQLPALGISGLEVAPSRRWQDTWHELTNADVVAYRHEIESAGLKVVGLHSLFFDHPDLGLFKESQKRKESLNFLEHLSGVCRDLGGRTLIYGGGRRRGTVPADDARHETISFFGELCRRIEDHGTCFCFEPLGPKDTDFINSARESLSIAQEINHPAVRVQLDAKALVENNEAVPATFAAVAPMLVHYHANEPGLNVLGSSGSIHHKALGGMLRDIAYDGFVSIEQRMLNEDAPLDDIAASAHVLQECY